MDRDVSGGVDSWREDGGGPRGMLLSYGQRKLLLAMKLVDFHVPASGHGSDCVESIDSVGKPETAAQLLAVPSVMRERVYPTCLSSLL